MPRFIAHMTALVVAVTLPGALNAQACLGLPSFGVNHMQLAGDASFDEDVTTFGAMLTSGSQSYFAGMGVGGRSVDGADGSTLLVRGQLGSQVPVSATGRIQACPLLTAEFGFGPSDIDGLGTDFSSRAFGFGVALGGAIAQNENISLVPSVSAGYRYDAGIFDGPGGSTTVSDTYATVGAAMGLVLGQALAIRPSVMMPVGVENAKPVFAIGVALNFGGRR